MDLGFRIFLHFQFSILHFQFPVVLPIFQSYEFYLYSNYLRLHVGCSSLRRNYLPSDDINIAVHKCVRSGIHGRLRVPWHNPPRN